MNREKDKWTTEQRDSDSVEMKKDKDRSTKQEDMMQPKKNEHRKKKSFERR